MTLPIEGTSLDEDDEGDDAGGELGEDGVRELVLVIIEGISSSKTKVGIITLKNVDAAPLTFLETKSSGVFEELSLLTKEQNERIK